MTFIDVLLPEYDRETGTTRRLLERLPEPAFDWKPHQRSTSLGALAAHLVELPCWVEIVMTGDSFDLATAPPPIAPPTTRMDLIRRFDQNVAKARTHLVDAIDGTLSAPWTLTRGSHDLFTMPKIAMLRYFVLNHLVHHRGQLSVYLRMHDVSIPAIYGPSADEGSFA